MGVIGISDDGLEVPEDLSLGKNGAIVTIQHVEPIFEVGETLDCSRAGLRKTYRTDHGGER